MFQGSIVYSKESSLLASFPHKTKINVHWTFNTLAILCTLIGYICIYINKDQNSKQHLVSWHGIIGFITVIYTCLQWFAGHFLTLFLKNVRNLISYSKLKRFHAFSGLFLYFFVTTTMILGLYSSWFQRFNSSYTQYLCIVAVLLSQLIVLNQMILKYVTKKTNAKPSNSEVERFINN
jgi:cytochrome b-561 domain-containing protein 2